MFYIYCFTNTANQKNTLDRQQLIRKDASRSIFIMRHMKPVPSITIPYTALCAYMDWINLHTK